MRLTSKITLTFCSLILILNNAYAEENAEFKSKINECNQLVKNDYAKKALDFSLQLIKQNKASRDALSCKGKAELALEQFSQAIETFKQVSQLSSTLTDKMMAQALLGNAYKGNKQIAEALESYRAALDSSKSAGNKGFERVSHELIASALFAGDKYDEALAEYQIALKLAQNDGERANIFERMAECYERQQNRDSAIEYQIKAALTHTKYGDLDKQANAQLELARMYIENNALNQAKTSIDKVLGFVKDNSDYWEAKCDIYLARLMHLSRKDAEARSLLASANKLNQALADKGLADLIQSTAASLLE